MKLTGIDVEYGACDVVGFVLGFSTLLRGGLPTELRLQIATLAYPWSRRSQLLSYQRIDEPRSHNSLLFGGPKALRDWYSWRVKMIHSFATNLAKYYLTNPYWG